MRRYHRPPVSREATLARLLRELFNADELRVHLVAEPGGPDLCADLPGTSVAHSVLTAEAVAALARRGGLDAGFFDRLIAARPQRADEIREVREPWAAPAAPVVDAWVVRYRQALAAACGRVRVAGMPVGGLGGAVDPLFIPLHLHRRRRRYTTDALLRASTDRTAAGQCRVVVLGDPGSGKTTLCRHLAATIARRSDDPLPFYLPLREYVAALARAPISIVEFLRQSAHERLSVALRVDDVTRALTSGRAVLLVDGVDEVGDATRRGEINERVVALAAAYPDIAIVVTSRIAGYEDAPLPRSGPAGFTRYRIDPFSADDLQAFVRRWYDLHTPDDPDRRERDIHGLLAALDAAPAVRELARNPLLATLIALVYRAEARLPADRPQLYERCLQLLLESWPESRGQRLPELDVDVQRGCLEDLAWDMLERATDASVGPTLVDRPALLARLTAGLVVGGPQARRRLAERWIGWLECETGILVEQTPGSFGFLHRSLGEYLAACHLDRRDDARRTTWILAHALDARWTEVALLHLGRHPDDTATREAVLAGLRSSPEGRNFLLMCAREGVGFDPAQLDPLIAACVAGDESRGLETLGVIVRCATRHASTVTAWFLGALAVVPPPELAPLLRVAARLELAPAEIDAALRRHPHAATVRTLALRLLPLVRGPGDTALLAVARESWRTAEPAHAVAALADTLPDDGDLVAAVVALGGPASPGACAALAVSLARAAAAAMQCVPAATGGLHVLWDSWSATLPTAPRRWPAPYRAPAPPAPTRRETLQSEANPIAGSVEPLLGYTGGDFACYAEAPPWQFLDYFEDVNVGAYIYECDPGRWEAWYAPHGVAREQLEAADPDDPEEEDEDDPLYLGNYTPEKVVVVDIHEGLGNLRVDFVDAGELPPADAPPWSDLLAAHRAGELDVGDLLCRVLALHAAQVRIAADVLSADDRWTDWYARQRQAHTWSWNNWPSLDAALPSAPDPARLALYLALGWAQQTTTHRWPATARWQGLARGQAPAHAWPRIQWHLIRWFDDPAGEDAVRAALAEAAADPVFAAAAAALGAALFTR